MKTSASRQQAAAWYESHLEGRLDRRWEAWFDEMTLTAGADGTTVLSGRVVDQAALHGLLARLRDLGLPLVSLVRVDPAEPSTSRWPCR
jgi:hypothetical protein